MAMSARLRMLTCLVAGVLAASSAKVLSESEASTEPCSAAQVAQNAKDHVLVQVQRSKTVREIKRGKTGCNFTVPQETPYYWEPSCTEDMVGCLADGVNVECRLCDHEYIPCPRSAWRPMRDKCVFDNEPLPVDVGYYYEPACPEVDGGLGCNADGIHVRCRLCGGGAYASVRCKVHQCSFDNEPTVPYYFDHDCKMGMLGCLADGTHLGCRYCGRGAYEGIPCPASASIPATECWFRNKPVNQSYYWDTNCTEGKLGCWADSMHAECRFCGGEPGSPYEAVPCP